VTKEATMDNRRNGTTPGEMLGEIFDLLTGLGVLLLPLGILAIPCAILLLPLALPLIPLALLALPYLAVRAVGRRVRAQP
jgi:hypothetical protein